MRLQLPSLLLFLIAPSCVSGDLTLDAPDFTYFKTAYQADFYQPGSSSAPSITGTVTRAHGPWTVTR